MIRIIGLTKCVHYIEDERLVGYEGKRIVVAWVSIECGLPPTNQMVRESQPQDCPVHFTETDLRCLAVYAQYSHLGKHGTKLVYMHCDLHSTLLQAKVRACSVNPTLGFHATSPSTWKNRPIDRTINYQWLLDVVGLNEVARTVADGSCPSPG